MRRLLFLVIFFLMHTFAYACVQDSDCPIPDCLGATRYCESSTCRQSTCLASLTSPNEQETSILPSLEETSFQEGFLDLLSSIISRWPAILGSIIFLICLSVLYNRFGFSGQFLGFAGILLILLFGTYHLVFVIYGITDPTVIWEKMQPEDFHTTQYSDVSLELTTEEKNNLADGIISAKRWYVRRGEKEYAVSILKFANKTAVSHWHFSQLDFTRTKLHGELIYRAQGKDNSIYLFDEDRFVFVVTGNDALISQELQQLVKRYPYRSDKWRSRLLLKGATAPQFLNLQPESGNALVKGPFSFLVVDDVAVDENSIMVEGIHGFDEMRSCRETEDHYECQFEPTLQPGMNTFSISAKDNAGNIAQKDVYLYKDLWRPEIKDVYPAEGQVVNDTLIRFSVEDDYKVDVTSITIEGLKGFEYGTKDCTLSNKSKTFCTFTSEPVEGLNVWTIQLEDDAGNTIKETFSFTYFNQPRIVVETPKLYSYTNNPTLIFVIADITGIEQKSIILSTSDSYEDVLPSCSLFGKGFDIRYKCIKNMPKKEGPVSVTITNIDALETTSKILHTFYVDLTAPSFENITVDQSREAVAFNFTVNDGYSGLDLESLEFSGIDSLDLDFSCDAEEDPQTAVCYLSFKDLPAGTHELELSINDKAGNVGKYTQSIQI